MLKRKEEDIVSYGCAVILIAAVFIIVYPNDVNLTTSMSNKAQAFDGIVTPILTALTIIFLAIQYRQAKSERSFDIVLRIYDQKILLIAEKIKSISESTHPLGTVGVGIIEITGVEAILIKFKRLGIRLLDDSTIEEIVNSLDLLLQLTDQIDNRNRILFDKIFLNEFGDLFAIFSEIKKSSELNSKNKFHAKIIKLSTYTSERADDRS